MFTLSFKGTAITISLIGAGNMLATKTFLILTLPNLLTAMFTTMGRNNWRKLLTHHPYLLLLPTYTFFTFEKLQTSCGCAEPDHKIRFSKRMTVFNIIINSVCFGVLFVLVHFWQFENTSNRRALTAQLLLFLLPLFIPAILFSMMFLFMEKCCGCCCLGAACCNIRDQIRVYHPDK